MFPSVFALDTQVRIAAAVLRKCRDSALGKVRHMGELFLCQDHVYITQLAPLISISHFKRIVLNIFSFKNNVK